MSIFSSNNKYFFGISILIIALFFNFKNIEKRDFGITSISYNFCESSKELISKISIENCDRINFTKTYYQIKNNFCFNNLLNDTCPTGHETDIWFMGKNGIDWSDDTPRVITGFNTSTWATWPPNFQEANTTICDRNGRLLLYTDNKGIYNGSHQLITTINGGTSSTMTLIIQKPGQDSIYYIFHPQEFTPYVSDLSSHALLFSVINVRGNNNFGTVVKKDQLLLQGSSEKITGVKHCNGKDWWVIGLRSEDEAFHVWLLTDTGLIQNNPVISYSGKLHNNALFSKFQNAGYLKPSHNGNLLTEVTFGWNNPGFLELHHFDPATGIVNDGLEVISIKDSLICFFVEFSPDNSKLYLPCFDNNDRMNVFQFDVSIWDSALIKKSMTQIFFGGRINALSPILGNDGRIYILTGERTHPLHVIYKPNKSGRNCDFRSFDFKFGSESADCAPNFPAGLQFPYRLFIQGPDLFCFRPDTIVQFILSDPCPHPNTEWSLPDGGKILNINGDTIDIHFPSPGIKRLIAAYPTPCGYKSDTLKIEVKYCDETSVNISSPDHEVNLFPNPTSNAVTFVFNKINIAVARFYLVDILNKVIIDKSIRIIDGKFQDSFDGLKPGVYFYSFSTGNKVFYKGKLIKILGK